MSYSVVWITLPNGFAPDGRARLSLVAAPRVLTSSTGTLAGTPLVDWPALVLPLIKNPIQLRVATDDPSSGLLPVQRDSPLPDSDLWRNLFPPTTPIDTRGGGAVALAGITPAKSFVQAAADVDAFYSGVDGANAQSGRPGRPRGSVPTLEARLDALAGLLAEPDATRRAALAADPAVAAVSGIADFLDGFRTAPARAGGPSGRADIGPISPLAGIRTVDQADFHQVVGLVMNHPTLSIPLGLRIDLLMPAFAGTRSIRVVTADGAPLNGDVQRPQSFSRVVADRNSGLFVMATQPSGAGIDTEVVRGMLDATPAAGSDSAKYLLTSNDVASLAMQLTGLASARGQARRRSAESGGLVPGPGPVRLPVRRDIGFTVAQKDRPDKLVKFAEIRADAIENTDAAVQRLAAERDADSAAALVPTLDGAAVLFADDVTNGYRVDVRADGGPPKSLMRRQVVYQVGDRTLPTPPGGDEGKVEPITAIAQTDGDGVVQLTTGEQLFTWAGYGLSVPKPGPVVLGVAGPNGETTDPTPSQPAVGYDLRMDVTAVPGSLPRLRFGRAYQLQVRTVDLAGNAIRPDQADPAHALPATPFRRKEAAPPPTVVPTERFTPGESLNHWVIRSDGDGNVIDRGSQRHLVPPRAPQMLAERHGMFDAAFGKSAAPAARDAMLQIAKRESGSVLDPTATGPDGTPVPAPGIAYVSNDPNAEPVHRPPRGEPLPNGYYVVHGTQNMLTPYLVDPIVDGACVLGVPGQAGPVDLPFTGGWPSVQGGRVVIDAGTGVLPVSSLRTEAGRPTLHIAVPPAARITAEIASTLRADRLAELETTADPAVLTSGADIAMSARQSVTIVHAVQKPLAAPTFTGGPTVTPIGDGSTVAVTATLQAHAASTSKVDVVASWRELSDPGNGPLIDERRSTSLGSPLITPTGAVALDGRAHFGDRRHRTIALTPSGTSAFREYFPVIDDRDPRLQRAGAPVTKSVKNRQQPPLPVVHSVVPTFSFTPSFDPTVPPSGQYTSIRVTTGVRVCLRRPWLLTGEGERLGVVVHTGDAAAQAALTGALPVQEFVSQWGGDPLQENDPAVWAPLVPDNFADSGLRTPARLIDPSARVSGDSVGPDVTVVSFPVTFDAERDLWFADIELDILPAMWPFLRLALVRIQPESVDNRIISRVVTTDFVQLPPTRTLVATRAAGVGVQVRVLGEPDQHGRFQMRQERRLGGPLVPAHDLGSSVGVGPTSIPDPLPPGETVPAFPQSSVLDGWKLSDLGPGQGASTRLRLERAPNAPSLDSTPALQAIKAELLAGRVVVEEIQTGIDARGPGRSTRVVWTDVFDRSILGMS